MIDIIKPLQSNEEKMHIDAIHGHTIIELKDVRTGFRDRIESDNVVTDGAESLLRTMGHQLNMWPQNSDNFPYWWQIFYGGLMLCDDTIPTTSIYKPAGINPVAYGAYKTSNSGNCTECGTYNNAESEFDRTHFKQVYDYYTNQANGTIKSACLMSAKGINSGYGCSVSNRVIPVSGTPANSYSNNIYNLNSVLTESQYSKYSYIIGDKCYEPQSEPITSGASQLKIKEYDFNPNEIQELNWSQPNCVAVPNREITFNFTAVTKNYWVIPVQFSHKFIGIPDATSSYPLYANTSYPLLVFDLDNETVSTLTITPTVNIVGYYDPTVKEISGAITFFARMSNNNIYIVNATNNSYAITNIAVSERYPDWSSGSSSVGIISIYCISDELYMVIYGTDSFSYIYDPTLNKKYMSRYSLIYRGGNFEIFYPSIRYLSDRDIYLARDYTSNSHNMKMIHNPLKLMTINNLPEAVEKTSNKTMKVTYELTME